MNKMYKFLFMFSCIINRFPFFNSIRVRGNEIKLKNAMLIRCSINCKGTNNTIIIKNNSILYKCKITIIGSNNKIIIDEDTVSKYANINIEDNYNKITIGARTRLCGKIKISCIESTEIFIGKDCMFSSEVEIRSGDSHGIYDVDGIRINHSKKIYIGDHVWLGFRVIVLKGAVIADDNVVGAGTIITHKFSETNCIIAGVPGKIIKNNILWDKYRIDRLNF